MKKLRLDDAPKQRFRQSLKQAVQPAQWANHIAHIGAALLLLSIFFFGANLPARAEGPVLVGLGFLAKEAVELFRRWLLGEDLHGADSLLDAAVVVLVCAIAPFALSARAAVIVGGLLLGGGLLIRRALKQAEVTAS